MFECALTEVFSSMLIFLVQSVENAFTRYGFKRRSVERLNWKIH